MKTLVKISGIKRGTLYRRIEILGMSPEKAIAKPARRYGTTHEISEEDHNRHAQLAEFRRLGELEDKILARMGAR